MKEEYVNDALIVFNTQSSNAIIGLYFKIIKNENLTGNQEKNLLKFLGNANFYDADVLKIQFREYTLKEEEKNKNE